SLKVWLLDTSLVLSTRKPSSSVLLNLVELTDSKTETKETLKRTRFFPHILIAPGKLCSSIADRQLKAAEGRSPAFGYCLWAEPPGTRPHRTVIQSFDGIERAELPPRVFGKL